jgi:hypothetical protein
LPGAFVLLFALKFSYRTRKATPDTDSGKRWLGC